jgi:DNA-binding transcriptional LysR family regulator
VLNLRQVESFVVAAELGTMTAASERLHVTPSAVSLAVSGLERALGTQLVIRRPSKGLTLTPAGRRFLGEARQLLTYAEDVRLAAESDGGTLHGRLTIGCYRTTAPFILPGLIKSFTEIHPEVELDFIEADQPDIEQALLDGRCEIAVMFTSDIGPGVEMEFIYATAPYVLLPADHPRASDERIDVHDLADEPFVLLDVPPSGPYLLSVLERAGVAPEIRYRSSGYELCRSLVAHGLGWALLISRPHGDLSYEGLPLIGRPLVGRAPRMHVGLAWPKGVRRTRRARAFAEHCKHLIPDHMGSGVGRPVSD